jgi:ABC-2 type transport system ATP-binding protein
MINVHSISKRFGPHIAINDFSCVANEGEILGLLGPNGAGKTTIMKIMMNMIKPDSGYVLLNGLDVQAADEYRIGYLPEERTMYRNVRINEMLLFLASMKNGNTEKAEKELDQWLIRFDLMDLKNNTIETLSNGMTQKVQFIAAVLHDPDFLFIDEPFSGLDPSSVELITRSILDLAALGKAVILSTHNIEIAEQVCSRVIMLDHGKEVLSGTISEVKDGYAKNKQQTLDFKEPSLKGIYSSLFLKKEYA